MEQYTLGSFLRFVRESNNRSLQEMIKNIKISKMYLSQIERDVKVPSDEVLKRIAETYKVDESYLFELIGRVPLSTKEELIEQLEVQRLLARAKNIEVNPETKKEMYNEIIDIFNRYIS